MRKSLEVLVAAVLIAASMVATGCGRRVDPRTQEAYDLVVAGKIDEAIAIANAVLGENPKSAQARNILGIALYKSGDAEGAVEQYQRALELDPKYAEAHFNLGNVYEQLGRLQDAEASFATAIRHQKNFVLAHYNLGHIYSVTNRPDQAVTELRRAVKGDDQFYPAYILLGQVSYNTGNFAEAITNLTRAVELVPQAPELRVLLGNSWLQSGGPDALTKAETEFRMAVSVDSASVDALYSLGLALAAQEKNEEAAEWFRRVRPLAVGRPESEALVRQMDEFFQRTGLPAGAAATSADSAQAASG